MASVAAVGTAAADTTSRAAATQGESSLSFSLFDTNGSIPRSGSFSITELSKYGVPEETVDRLIGASDGSAVAEGASTTANAEPAPTPYEIVDTWEETEGWTTNMRQGYWNTATDRGFGLTKIEEKHNLSLDAVKATTTWPRSEGGKVETGTNKFDYLTDVAHVECSGWWIFRDCDITEWKTVRAVVDFRRLKPDDTTFGVVTAYCDNTPGKCPDWVREAINI
jgi:hypothetical protein